MHYWFFYLILIQMWTFACPLLRRAWNECMFVCRINRFVLFFTILIFAFFNIFSKNIHKVCVLWAKKKETNNLNIWKHKSISTSEREVERINQNATFFALYFFRISLRCAYMLCTVMDGNFGNDLIVCCNVSIVVTDDDAAAAATAVIITIIIIITD